MTGKEQATRLTKQRREILDRIGRYGASRRRPRALGGPERWFVSSTQLPSQVARWLADSGLVEVDAGSVHPYGTPYQLSAAGRAALGLDKASRGGPAVLAPGEATRLGIEAMGAQGAREAGRD